LVVGGGGECGDDDGIHGAMVTHDTGDQCFLTMQKENGIPCEKSYWVVERNILWLYYDHCFDLDHEYSQRIRPYDPRNQLPWLEAIQ
jgi:hypothetical protein